MIRNILIGLSACILSVTFASCSNGTETDDGEGDIVQPFTLSVDKKAIESDGTDEAVFTITDANGKDLTDRTHLKKTSFHIEETDEYLSGMILEQPNRFSSITDGTYTISAMYDGKSCANTVTVTSQNRNKYELFFKRVALYRLTATWCGYCPEMSKALEKIDQFTKDHSLVLEFHNNDEFSIPYSSTEDLASMLLKKFSTGDEGLPFCIYSLSAGTSRRSVLEITSMIKDQLYSNPAKTGIKAASVVSGTTLTVNASVKASASGTYDLGMAILEDNCISTSQSAYESSYSNVVRSISGNLFAMAQDSSFQLDAGKEADIQKTWTSEILGSGQDKLSVILFTLRESGGKTIIDNIIKFKPGESIDYRYN